MDPTTWKAIKETFSAALELPLPEREGFLSSSSEEIRREVERLLATYAEAKTFIGMPIIVEKGLREKATEASLVGKQIDQYLILQSSAKVAWALSFSPSIAARASRSVSRSN